MRSRLEHLLAPGVVDDLEQLIREMVQVELDNDHERNGHTSKSWYTTEEAAERLGVTPKAVRQQAYRGRHEVKYLGRRMYVSAKSVDG